MTELSPEARRILAQARSAQPRASKALRARVRAEVTSSLSLAAASGNAGSATRRTPSAGKPWLVPAACGAAVLAGLSLAVWPDRVSRPAPTPPVAASRASSKDALLSADAGTPPAPTAHETTAGLVQRTPISNDDAQAGEPLSRAVDGTSGQTTKSVRPAAASDDLRAEMNLLARAEAALRQHDPGTALQELAAHAQRFRSGQLQAERAGLRLIALCMQGREPKTTVARYLNNSADAVLRTRVREACRRPLP